MTTNSTAKEPSNKKDKKKKKEEDWKRALFGATFIGALLITFNEASLFVHVNRNMLLRIKHWIRDAIAIQMQVTWQMPNT